MKKLDSRFGSQGVVGFDGKPKTTGMRKTVDHVSGKFDVNALWGGKTDYSFKATDKGGNDHHPPHQAASAASRLAQGTRGDGCDREIASRSSDRDSSSRLAP